MCQTKENQDGFVAPCMYLCWVLFTPSWCFVAGGASGLWEGDMRGGVHPPSSGHLLPSMRHVLLWGRALRQRAVLPTQWLQALPLSGEPKGKGPRPNVCWMRPVSTHDSWLCAALGDLQWMVAWMRPVNTQDWLCAARDDLQRIVAWTRLLTHRTACVQLGMICSGWLHGQGC